MSPNEFHIDDDDLPVGRILSRREAVRMLGLSAGVLFVGGCSEDDATGLDDGTGGTNNGTVTTCTAKPALTEGPYYVDTALNRTDIRSNAASGALRTGVPLALNFTINRINGGAWVSYTTGFSLTSGQTLGWKFESADNDSFTCAVKVANVPLDTFNVVASGFGGGA